MKNIPIKEKHYSGKQIIKAGEYLIMDDAHSDLEKFNFAMDVLSFWRFSHEIPLQKALSILEQVTKKVEKTPIFAKRLKRQASIVSKLKRFNKMKLKNMQDIGGCRTVVSSKKRMYQVLRELKSRMPTVDGKNKFRVKDYIKEPKTDGYRGIHITGLFLDNLAESKSIEIKLRTHIQHYWATAVEIVDLYTGQALKSNQGEEQWALFFKLVSKHFSLMENIHQFERLPLAEKATTYYRSLINNNNAIDSLMVIKALYTSLAINVKFEAFQHTLKMINEFIEQEKDAGYVLLEIDTSKKEIKSSIFSKEQSSIAESLYTASEKNNATLPFKVVALVSANAVGGVKEAYPNYFADSEKFVELIMIIINAPFSKDIPPRRKLAVEM
jgi:ppGpp synthetase/RelA/SpoT-type nucleotidyltranferase